MVLSKLSNWIEKKIHKPCQLHVYPYETPKEELDNICNAMLQKVFYKNVICREHVFIYDNQMMVSTIVTIQRHRSQAPMQLSYRAVDFHLQENISRKTMN